MKYALFITALIMSLLSCSKDPMEKEDALTTGSWKLTAEVRDYTKDGVYEEDTYALYDPCIIDNVYTFQADGTTITDEGPIHCYPGNPQTSTYTWSFSDHQSQLHWGGADYEIEELTDATMRLQGRFPYNIIFTMDVKSTYTKQ